MSTSRWAVAAIMAVAALGLAACGTSASSSSAPAARAPSSATQPAAQAPASSAPAAGGSVDPGPVPTGPAASLNYAAGVPGNWSQTQWQQYWADLGIPAGDTKGACYANAVATQVSFTDAAAFAQAFPPGTSGKAETDYIAALQAKGMSSADATAVVSEVTAAEQNSTC
jgi:hypothetical protein